MSVLEKWACPLCQTTTAVRGATEVGHNCPKIPYTPGSKRSHFVQFEKVEK